MNITISGNLKGQTVFFLAGWPDTADVFRDNLMRAMEDTYRLVGLSLPGYTDSMPFVRYYQSRQSDAANPDAEPVHDEHGRSAWVPFRKSKPTDEPHRATRRERRLTRQAPRLARTPRGGYSFEDLVDLLELAVDMAMRTHNYAPDVILAVEPATSTNANTGDERRRSSPDGLPAHRALPQYTRPIFIAHDWGASLLFELLLRRPHFFSRVVALDVAPSVFDASDTLFAIASAQRVREQRQQQRHKQPQSPETSGPLSSSPLSGPAGSGWSSVHTPTVATASTTSPSTPAGNINMTTTVNNSIGSWPSPHALANSMPGADEDCGRPYGTAAASSPTTGPVSEMRAARRRTLASRYAMCTNSNRPVAWKQPPRGRLAQYAKLLIIALYQLTLVLFYTLVPSCVARVVVPIMARLLGRPDYTFDPRLVVTADSEALNARVRSATYHGTAAHGAGSDAGSPLTAFMLSDSLQAGHWKILLVPFTVPAPETRSADLGSGGSGGGGGGGNAAGTYGGASDTLAFPGVADRVAYQSYYFPPPARGVDDKASSGVSGTGSGVRSLSSRAAAVRAKSEMVYALPSMGYVYFRFWLGILLSCLLSSSSTPSPSPSSLSAQYDTARRPSTPSGAPLFSDVMTAALTHRHGHSPLISQRYDIPITVPILYMYGAHKPFMFHSRQFCAYVEYCKRAEDGISGVVEIKDGGHWFFADPRFRSEVAEHVWDFCQSVPT